MYKICDTSEKELVSIFDIGTPGNVLVASHISPFIASSMSLKVLTNNWGLDLDILAHEICQVELYQRIGFYKFNYKIAS